MRQNLPVDQAELSTLGEAGFEQKYVHEVYERIADHFSHTRYRGWPRVCDWLKQHSKPSDLVADIGSGNGKYCTSVHPQALWLGSDYSYNLCANAREITAASDSKRLFLTEAPTFKPVEVCRADGLALPFRSRSADLTICIAVLHHLTTEERRAKCISELSRITKRRLLIYVWADKHVEGSVGARQFDKSESKSPVFDRTRFYNLCSAGSLELPRWSVLPVL